MTKDFLLAILKPFIFVLQSMRKVLYGPIEFFFAVVRRVAIEKESSLCLMYIKSLTALSLNLRVIYIDVAMNCELWYFFNAAHQHLLPSDGLLA